MEFSNINDYLKRGSDQLVNFKFSQSNKKNEDDVNNKIDMIFSVLSRLEEKVDSIEKRLCEDKHPSFQIQSGMVQPQMVNTQQVELTMKEIKPQVFDDIEEKVLKAHLRKRRVESDGSLLYKIYFEGLPRNLFPIRIVRKSSIEYWLNGRWNEDMDGEYIRETLSKNLLASYSKVNKFSSALSGSVESDFMKNQNYILSLRDKKYQGQLWDYLKKNYLY